MRNNSITLPLPNVNDSIQRQRGWNYPVWWLRYNLEFLSRKNLSCDAESEGRNWSDDIDDLISAFRAQASVIDNISGTCLFLFNPHTNPKRHGYHCFSHFTLRILGLNLFSDLYTCHYGDTGNAEPGFEPRSIWPWSPCCSPSLHNYYAAPYCSFRFGGHLTVALHHAPRDNPDLYSVGAEVGHVINSAMFPSSCGQERRVCESSWYLKSPLFPAAHLIHI